MGQIHHKVIDDAYDFTIDVNGEIHGLVDGDMGYEPTGIKLDELSLKIWRLGLDAWGEGEGNKKST